MTDSSVRERVTGSVTNGAVLCKCGRKVGLVNDDGTAEWFCRHCRVNVVVDLKLAKLTALSKIADHIAKL